MNAETDVFFSRHAFERLREHYANVGVRGARVLLSQAKQITESAAATLTARGAPAEFMKVSTYYLGADKRGIFVLAPARQPGQLPWTCVTYIRLDLPMQDEAERMFP